MVGRYLILRRERQNFVQHTKYWKCLESRGDLFYVKVMSKRDTVHRYLSQDGFIRASAVVATSSVDQMRNTLNSLPLATIAAGRSLIASTLMVSHIKEGSVGINFKGNGPLGTVYAEAHSNGECRAYVRNPQVRLALKNGKWDVGAAVGRGNLEVLRGSPFQKANHIGHVEIQTGEVGDDIAFYLKQSQQIPAIVALTVDVGEYGEVTSAGGTLLELMPGHPKEVITRLEEQLHKVPGLNHLIEAGASADDIIAPFFGDIPYTKFDSDFKMKYGCKCNKKRAVESMFLLGQKTLDEMVEDQQSEEIICDFCGKKYIVTPEEIEKVRNERPDDLVACSG